MKEFVEEDSMSEQDYPENPWDVEETEEEDDD